MKLQKYRITVAPDLCRGIFNIIHSFSCSTKEHLLFQSNKDHGLATRIAKISYQHLLPCIGMGPGLREPGSQCKKPSAHRKSSMCLSMLVSQSNANIYYAASQTGRMNISVTLLDIWYIFWNDMQRLAIQQQRQLQTINILTISPKNPISIYNIQVNINTNYPKKAKKLFEK